MLIKSFLCLFCFMLTSIQASEWLAEVRAGYFYPTSKKFRDIYRQGGVEGEVEFVKSFSDNLSLFGNANYFQIDGHSLGLRDRTTIRMLPVSVGLKTQICLFDCLTPYLGAGVVCTFLNVKNHSHYVRREVTRNRFGFVIKSGFYVEMCNNSVIDLFVDYYYTKIPVYTPHEADVGGLRMGIGYGYRF